MPFAQVNGVTLYYETAGQGTPLVLIEGIGYASWMWLRQREALGARHRLVVFDNRDVGLSSLVEQPYTIRDMAVDLAGLLDNLGIPRAHILGVSMGGFIAQEFAIAYPERVWGLVLAATHFGGKEAIPVPAETVKLMVPDPNLPPEERIRAAMPAAFAPGYVEAHPEVLDELVPLRLASVQPPEAWLRQAAASANYDTSAQLASVTAPTLILQGDQDRVVPAENANLLAGRLPHCELAMLAGAGHLAIIEQADRFNALVLDFLARVEAMTPVLEAG